MTDPALNELAELEDPHACHEPLSLDGTSTAELERLLRTMMLVRYAEERIGDEVTSGKVRCPCHLAIGQEAVPVGVSRALRATDRVFGAHRSHGHYLALGGPVLGLFAEVMGRDTGVSRGMGGSMHLLDRARGLLGTVPIVGATIPIATGAALASKREKSGDVAVSYFGDGATEEGVFHESLNLAASMKLPVLYVCEHNLFSSHLHVGLRQPAHSTARYAEAHRIPWRRIDGNDVLAIARIAQELVTEMRREPGPRYIEAVTYRWRGHVGPREDEDVGVKRKDDLGLWKRRDPIGRLREAMVAGGRSKPEDIERISGEVRAEVASAWTEASNAPFPPESALLDRVYAVRAS